MEMDRQEIMEYIAERFGIEPNENGEYDINDYDWQAGCYCNDGWLNLAVIVEIVEDLMK